ncbi:DNAJ heat shock N-terminal domain-containing protein [Cavenderia fasciculata]|uniref:DNAJ heat shock N-terminal domain-containing protein n=1 Tax=Cavenderia fasciculata TaxID=261658 RepID=F4Q5J1_CACFS|nr:DNAJ heat shock N-terminal domain-containing protein [Cavenderia fasciculata]EGG17250.1 DNAJ heat shock N-terminal domain-containing protein [Cavenderia fasciculata]|eukprot:XP_004355734.1 DNAJ heat shock N-terminal domain-containing protein [Cavenderia fasciculata]
MGAVDKTHDEVLDNNLSNLKRLGEFMNHLEETTQQSMLNMERMCQTNSALATSMCNFILSELSDEKEFSTGLLSKFFKRTTPESGDLSIRFQDSVQRLYDSFGTIGHDNLRTTIESLDTNVVIPFKRDKEMNKVTKQVLEKRKKLNLDYDSTKRASSDMDKIRMAKEEFDQASKNTNNHIQTRSFIRCKLIVHSIITLVQQFCIFFESNSVLLEGLLGFIEPMVDTYQLDIPELADIYRPKKPTSPSTPPPQHNRPSSPTPPPVYPSPPPSYKDSVNSNSNSHTRPRSGSSGQQQQQPLHGQFRNMNMNDNGPYSPTGGSSSEDSSPPSTKRNDSRNENLFSVWDDENSNNSNSNNSNSNNNNNNTNGNNTSSSSSTTTTTKSGFGDDWMYETPNSTPKESPFKPTPNSSSTNATNTNSPSSSNQYEFQSPHQRQQPPQQPSNGSYNPPPFQQQQQQQTRQPPPPQQQQWNNKNNSNNNQQQQPPQSQPAPPPPTNQNKSSYDHIFGDFDFPPSSTTSSTGSGGGTQPQQFTSFFMPNSQPPPSMNFSPHVDHRAQSERETLEPAISEKVKRWAEASTGKKNDIRMLISTLHEVLWEGSGWEKVNRGQMVAPTQVKKYYRKAIMVVHPDKVNLGSTEQKIVAQRIFERLRDEFEILRVRDLEPSSQ